MVFEADFRRESEVDEDEELSPKTMSGSVKIVLSKFVLAESNVVRMAYEFVLLIMLVYVGTIFPYRLAFIHYRLNEDATCNEVEELFSWEVVEYCVQYFFYADLVINFFITYRQGSREITDPFMIGKNYIFGFFLMNALACCPGKVFMPLVEALGVDPGGCGASEHGNDAARLVRLQRVTRLVRLARLLRFSKTLAKIQDQLSDSVQKIIKRASYLNLLFLLFWVIHVLACGWYLCAAIHVDHQSTWVGRRTVGDYSLLLQPPPVQWAQSMYFVLTVFTTVGFGDMSAETVGEIIYVGLVMLIGAVVHSIIIGNVINLVSEQSEDEKWRESQKGILTAFGHQTQMEQSSINKLTNYIDQLESSGEAEYDREEMRNLITGGGLSRKLLGELPPQLFQGLLMDSKLVKACSSSCYAGVIPPRFAILLSTMLHVQHFKEQEIIMQLHDSASNIFIIQSGTFAAIGEPGPLGGSDATLFNTIRGATMPQQTPQTQQVESASRHPTETRPPSASIPSAGSDSHETDPGSMMPLGTKWFHKMVARRRSDPNVLPANETNGVERSYSSVADPNCVSDLNQQGSAWIPHVSDEQQWIVINLGRLKCVSGVKLAGHPDEDAWVTRFRITTSTTRDFYAPRVSEADASNEVDGCMDRDTEVEVSFPPRTAQYIRIEPVQWHEKIAIRAAIVLSPMSLFPYMLRGKKNYFGDEVLICSTRTCTMRCEADGQVLLLHKRDLFSDGAGGRLFLDFPQFQRVLLAAARRRHTHRQSMLARLTTGCSYRHLAASVIQGAWRQTVSKSDGSHRHERRRRIGDTAELLINRPAAVNSPTRVSKVEARPASKRRGSDPSSFKFLSADQKFIGLHDRVEELRQEVTGKLDGLAASHIQLAGQLEAVASQLQQLVSRQR